MSKWVAQIDQTDRIPEYISRAFSVATSGRPGPVVLALPEDTLWGISQVADLPRYQRTVSYPGQQDLAHMQALLEQAQRPMMIVGGSGWTNEAVRDIASFAQRFALPVGAAWRRLECFDQEHPNFAGHVGWGMDETLRHRIEDADLILAVGTRLGEATTIGYTLIESPVPRQQLVHVYPDSSEIGRVFMPAQGIVASVTAFAAAVAALKPSREVNTDQVREAHRQYQDGLKPLPFPGQMSLDEAAVHVGKVIPEDACLTVGAGNYALYPHRYRRFRGLGTSLAPTVGSMGYGLPAAISAKLENPEKTVVCYAGDGCFQMNIQELGVAMQYRLGIIILVFNNGIWGTIRAHQEREFPARAIALDFENPDFTQIIRAYGGHGEAVESTAEFPDAFQRARDFADSQHLPALLEIRYDANGIAPGDTLMGIRERAQLGHSSI